MFKKSQYIGIIGIEKMWAKKLSELTDGMSKDCKKNARFIEKRAPKLHGALIDLADDINGVPLRCCPYNSESRHDYTLSSMSFEIAHPELISLTFNLLMGNLPTCYMSMRVILEAIVDSTIASLRFQDYPYPKNLEQLRVLETRKNLRVFNDKCDLLLPAEISEGTRKKIKDLYAYLSEYWVHPKGTVKKLKQISDDHVKRFGRDIIGPSWILAIPYHYGTWDIDTLREFSQKLTELRDNVRALLQPFIKAGEQYIEPLPITITLPVSKRKQGKTIQKRKKKLLRKV